MESNALFDRHLAQTTPYPIGLEIERAEGIYLYTPEGKRYMDLISGVGVSALGHGNPEVRAAIKYQVDQHMHVMVYGEYLQSAQSQAAATLTRLLPGSLDTVYFVNSGAEANEAALKLARRVTGRTEMIAFAGGYHGGTTGALALSGNEQKKYAFRPLLPDVRHIRLNDFEALKHITERTAGVLLETIQGDAGIRIPDAKWMQALRARCTEVGALLILDEIQCGLGRAGSWFAFEQFDIVPDALTLGKALGAGMPVGALVAGRGLMEQFTHDPMLGHITTFGGHPVICAAVNAGLLALERDYIIPGVSRKGRRFRKHLGDHKQVVEFRQTGLFMAVELASPEAVQQVVAYCLERGVIGFWFLSCPEAFRLAPPLVISDAEIDTACSVIRAALDQL